MATFGLYLDTLVAIYMACVVFYYILFETGAPGVKIGLAISQTFSLTGRFPWGESFFYALSIIIYHLYGLSVD